MTVLCVLQEFWNRIYILFGIFDCEGFIYKLAVKHRSSLNSYPSPYFHSYFSIFKRLIIDKYIAKENNFKVKNWTLFFTRYTLFIIWLFKSLGHPPLPTPNDLITTFPRRQCWRGTREEWMLRHLKCALSGVSYLELCTIYELLKDDTIFPTLKYVVV